MMAGFDLHSFCVRCCDKKKGKDPCVEKPNVECQLCKAVTPEQVSQLATPSYKLIKEKRDKVESSKKDSSSSTSVTLSPTLVDPARVSVIRAVDGQDTGLSAQPAEKKKKVEEEVGQAQAFYLNCGCSVHRPEISRTGPEMVGPVQPA